MSASQKTITVKQLQQATDELGLTVAVIAEGSGLSKAYISEFRGETRNLKPPQQAQLRGFLEAQYEARGWEFPENEGASPSGFYQDLGGMIQRITRPAILLSEDVPRAQADKLTDLIEANRLKVTDILAGKFEDGGFLGGEYSAATENAIREVFALLALNYVAILMLQGRNIARLVPEGSTPKTLGDWLSGYLSTSPIAGMLSGEAASEDEAEVA